MCGEPGSTHALPVVGFAVARQRDEAHRSHTVQSRGELATVDIAEREIDQADLGLEAVYELEGGRAVVRDRHVVAEHSKPEFEGARRELVIVDYQDAPVGSHAFTPCA
jgi:hypothetical protein